MDLIAGLNRTKNHESIEGNRVTWNGALSTCRRAIKSGASGGDDSKTSGYPKVQGKRIFHNFYCSQKYYISATSEQLL